MPELSDIAVLVFQYIPQAAYEICKYVYDMVIVNMEFLNVAYLYNYWHHGLICSFVDYG
jgi:hypothetical protein